MKILIVDDEPLARARLAAQISDLGTGEVVGEAGDGLAALAQVALLAPDLVLLDVRMPGMDGLETARHLRRLPHSPIIIFTTAFDQHALAAFETQALDYLLKPVRSERLREALQRAQTFSAGRDVLAVEARAPLGRRYHVSAIIGGSLRLLPLAEVIYFQAVQGYTSAVAADSELVIEDPLRTLEEEFADDFVRTHRNALVAPAHGCALDRDGAGNVVVVLAARPERLIVGRRLFGQVRQRLRAV